MTVGLEAGRQGNTSTAGYWTLILLVMVKGSGQFGGNELGGKRGGTSRG